MEVVEKYVAIVENLGELLNMYFKEHHIDDERRFKRNGEAISCAFVEDKSNVDKKPVVEEVIKKSETKKENFGNVLGSMRGSRAGRYGRRRGLVIASPSAKASDRPPLDTLSVGDLGAYIGRTKRNSEYLLPPV